MKRIFVTVLALAVFALAGCKMAEEEPEKTYDVSTSSTVVKVLNPGTRICYQYIGIYGTTQKNYLYVYDDYYVGKGPKCHTFYIINIGPENTYTLFDSVKEKTVENKIFKIDYVYEFLDEHTKINYVVLDETNNMPDAADKVLYIGY